MSFKKLPLISNDTDIIIEVKVLPATAVLVPVVATPHFSHCLLITQHFCRYKKNVRKIQMGMLETPLAHCA